MVWAVPPCPPSGVFHAGLRDKDLEKLRGAEQDYEQQLAAMRSLMPGRRVSLHSHQGVM
jgi:hypothetical protein